MVEGPRQGPQEEILLDLLRAERQQNEILQNHLVQLSNEVVKVEARSRRKKAAVVRQPAPGSGQVQLATARMVLVGVIVSAVLGGVGTVLGVTLDNPPAAETPSTTSSVSCKVVNQDVYDMVKTGQRDPTILEKLNSEEVDKQCGEETDIAKGILATNPDLGKR